MSNLIRYLIITCLLMIKVNIVIAGTTCKNFEADPKKYFLASRQAAFLNHQLNRINAEVVLISRVGTNLAKYGIHYSHVGFAVKNFSGRKNKWTIIHLLNNCGTRYSSIYAQGLMNYFMDDLYNMDYQITILKPILAQKLNKTLRTSLVGKMHNRRYNMIAYPFSRSYQNSNQWVLEFIEATESNLTSQKMVQIELIKKGFKPSVIYTDSFSKLGATIFGSTIIFDDHPINEQSSNHYSVVTVDSIIRYLNKQRKLVKNIDHRDHTY